MKTLFTEGGRDVLAEAAKARWKHETVTIPGRKGPITFKAWVLGSWAVHGRPPAAVTHLPSGKMMSQGSGERGGTQAETKAAVEEMVTTDPILLNLPTEADVLKHLPLVAKWSHKIRGYGAAKPQLAGKADPKWSKRYRRSS